MGLTLAVVIAVLLIALFLGAPVSSALGFTAVAAIFLYMDPVNLSRFGAIAYAQGTSINQMVAPLFIVMAEFLARGGIANDIYELLNNLLKKFRGGLALSTVLACTVFAALCGSSPATAASIGRISIFQMTKRGYNPSLAVGTVAAGGTLGIMIPPSLTFVLYGILTETSIAKLLMAGLLPGLMLSGLFIISIIIRAKLNPSLVGEAKNPPELPAENGRAGEIAADAVHKNRAGVAVASSSLAVQKRTTGIAVAIPSLILILVVLGTLYTGIATPTEAAGFGAVGAIIIIIFLKRFSKKLFLEATQATARTSCMILFMIIMGFALSYVISYLGIAQQLATFIVGIGINRWVVMVLLFIFWLVLGCLMDPGSMVILTIPFIYPVLLAMGFDSIWIGVVSTLCVEIGMITPPVGLNLFVLRSVADVPMGQIIKGAIPYVGVLLIGLVILCIFPQIALFLPSLM